jgi:MEDS: MEthanogen/methylotroph, DcmR Sensory domain
MQELPTCATRCDEMATKVSVLADADAPSHIVYPCTDESLIAESVGIFAASGLRKGDAVVLVTTDRRRKTIESRLTAETFDIESLKRTGQLAFLDAGALLSAIGADGMPDAQNFKRHLGQIIDRASLNPANGATRKIRIFGEMVSLLYMDGNVPAAARLEEFWEELVKAHSISLFCAYSLKPGSDRLPQSLLDLHSHDLSSPVH